MVLRYYIYAMAVIASNVSKLSKMSYLRHSSRFLTIGDYLKCRPDGTQIAKHTRVNYTAHLLISLRPVEGSVLAAKLSLAGVTESPES